MARADFDPTTVRPDGRPPAKATLFGPQAPRPWRGSLDGETLGGPVTVLAYGTDTPGEGPRLHVHPYDETFIVLEGRARFFVGDAVIEAQAGEVVLGPKGVPHRFENLGPGRLQTIDIHHSPRWIQTDLAELSDPTV
jgi:mannose-6-phosphate isomerase-like protein (cupin superfamily)